MKLRSATVALIVAICGACTGVDGGGGGVTRADLVAALRKGTDQATAECVADGLLGAGITQSELQEFASFSGDDELPSRIDVYDRVRAACGPSEQRRRSISTPLNAAEKLALIGASLIGDRQNASLLHMSITSPGRFEVPILGV